MDIEEGCDLGETDPDYAVVKATEVKDLDRAFWKTVTLKLMKRVNFLERKVKKLEQNHDGRGNEEELKKLLD